MFTGWTEKTVLLLLILSHRLLFRPTVLAIKHILQVSGWRNRPRPVHSQPIRKDGKQSGDGCVRIGFPEGYRLFFNVCLPDAFFRQKADGRNHHTVKGS
jgi:hypothetical protein